MTKIKMAARYEELLLSFFNIMGYSAEDDFSMRFGEDSLVIDNTTQTDHCFSC